LHQISSQIVSIPMNWPHKSGLVIYCEKMHLVAQAKRL
jgi:hypothetical protein